MGWSWLGQAGKVGEVVISCTFATTAEMGVSTSIIVKTFPSRLVPTLIATDLTSTRVMHERYGVFSSDGFDVGHDQEVAFPGPCNIALKAYSRIKVHGILEIGTRPSSDGGRTWVHSQVAGGEKGWGGIDVHGEGATVRIEDALISGSGYSLSHGKDKGFGHRPEPALFDVRAGARIELTRVSLVGGGRPGHCWPQSTNSFGQDARAGLHMWRTVAGLRRACISERIFRFSQTVEQP